MKKRNHQKNLIKRQTIKFYARKAVFASPPRALSKRVTKEKDQFPCTVSRQINPKTKILACL
jgi:hypothetical protein